MASAKGGWVTWRPSSCTQRSPEPSGLLWRQPNPPHQIGARWRAANSARVIQAV